MFFDTNLTYIKLVWYYDITQTIKENNMKNYDLDYNGYNFDYDDEENEIVTEDDE